MASSSSALVTNSRTRFACSTITNFFRGFGASAAPFARWPESVRFNFRTDDGEAGVACAWLDDEAPEPVPSADELATPAAN
jgi:hypothetical protein